MKSFWGLLGLIALLGGSILLPQRAYAASIGVVSVTVKVRPPSDRRTNLHSIVSNQRLQHLTYRAILHTYPFALMSRYV